MLSFIEKELSNRKSVLDEVYVSMQNYIYTASIIINEAIDKNSNTFIFGNGQNITNVNNLAFMLKKIKNSRVTSLCKDTILLSEIAENYGYERVFDKQIESEAKDGDLLIGFSTSGASKNVLRALSLGRNIGCKTIGFSGQNYSIMDEFCDLNLVAPSEEKSIIIEMHMVMTNIVIRGLI